LKNFIYRLALLAREDVVDVAGITDLLGQEQPVQSEGDNDRAKLDQAIVDWLASARPAPGMVYGEAMAAFERPLFAQVLRETRGNQLRAAQQLGINRNTLRKRLTELALNPEDFAGRG
jgi:two-component system nitrogen regulation response regulator GlnG